MGTPSDGLTEYICLYMSNENDYNAGGLTYEFLKTGYRSIPSSNEPNCFVLTEPNSSTIIEVCEIDHSFSVVFIYYLVVVKSWEVLLGNSIGEIEFVSEILSGELGFSIWGKLRLVC